MRATTDAASLRDLADWCARIAPTRPQHPMLAAVHLAFTADGLTATVTDYDTFGRATVPVVADTATDLAVSARLLQQVTTALAGKGNARVEIEQDGGRLRLACRSMRAAVPLMAAEDFPAWPTKEPTHLRAISGPLLATALDHALAAAARDDTLPSLYAVQMESSPDGLRLVATDKFRIPVADLPWLEAADFRYHSTVLIARPAALVMARSAKTAERVVLGLPTPEDGNTVLFGTPGRVVLSRLVAEKFPNYPALFPDGKVGRSWSADSDDLVALAKSIGGLSESVTEKGDRFTGRLRLTLGGGRLTITADGDSEATGSIDAEHDDDWDTDPWEFGTNAEFLADAVTAIPCPRVKFTHTAAARSMLISPDGDATYTATGLLMPVRLPVTAERSAA